MNKLLTVVIPTYNMERFLRQCLDSFIDESILDVIEIIIVNDGSRDSSAEIAEEYVYKYPDSFILINKENGGHGSTINKGIEIATSKYFKVVDSDDWVDTKAFAHFVQKLKNTDSDCVVTRFNYHFQDTGTIKLDDNTDGLPAEEEFVLLKHICRFIPMHSLCFKTSVLKNNNIRLFEHCFYVDIQYAMYPLPYIQTAVFYDCVVYQYRLDREGQSVSAQGFRRHYLEHERVTESILVFFENNRDKLGENWEKLRTIFTVFVNRHYALIILNADDKTIINGLRAFDKRIKMKYPGIYKRIIFNRKVKVCIRLNFRFLKLLRGLNRLLKVKNNV